MTTPAYAPAPSQAAQQQAAQQAQVSPAGVAVIASALSSAVNVAGAMAMIVPALGAWSKMKAAALQGALQTVYGMPPGQQGFYGPATQNMVALNTVRRAQFVAAAWQRLLADGLQAVLSGQDPGAALNDGASRERRYYGQHLTAMWNRMNAAARVDSAAMSHGLLLGWNTVIDKRTSPECRAADRHNFRADTIPLIGLPGAAHPHCRCWPGRPFRNAPLLPGTAPVMVAA